MLPSFLKMAFLRPRQQGPPVSRRGCGETVPASPPSFPCASGKHSLGTVTPRWPICGQCPGDTSVAVGQSQRRAQSKSRPGTRRDQLWQPARLPARPSLSTDLPVHCPVFWGWSPYFHLVIKFFISGRARIFPLNSPALAFSNPSKCIIMCKPATDLSFIHFPGAFGPTLLRIKYINSNQ